MIGRWIETLKNEDSCINEEIIDDYVAFKENATMNELKNYKDEIGYVEDKVIK